MNRLIKSIVGIALAASIVGGGIWAALTGDIGVSDVVRFEISADVVITAGAYKGDSTVAYSQFNHNSTQTNPPTVWELGTDTEPTMITKADGFITYRFEFDNIGTTDIKVKFTEVECGDEEGTDYTLTGGLVVADEVTDAQEVVIVEDGAAVVFEYKLLLVNRNSNCEASVSFTVAVTQVADTL